MKSAILFNFLVDKENRKIKVQRSFNAPIDLVWSAWTEAEILDKWWAPKPWRAETKSMDFKEGGRWLYCMIGPEGERHWALFDYDKIIKEKSFSGSDAFCDENAQIADTMPRSFWENNFTDKTDSTIVDIEISFKELSDLETTIQMGFKEGFTMGLENLDEYLKSQS